MPLRLATLHQGVGRLADLRDRPRGTRHLGAMQSVWTESTTTDVRPLRLDRAGDRLQVRLRKGGHVECPLPQPLGAHPDLCRRLLAGDVQRAAAGADHVAERHRGDRRLADAGRAAEQDERARDQAAAQDAVELPDTRGEPFLAGRGDVAERNGAGCRSGGGRRPPPPEEPRPEFAGITTSSRVFHSPQPAHRPDHASASWPQSRQTVSAPLLCHPSILPSPGDGFSPRHGHPARTSEDPCEIARAGLRSARAPLTEANRGGRGERNREARSLRSPRWSCP